MLPGKASSRTHCIARLRARSHRAGFGAHLDAVAMGSNTHASLSELSRCNGGVSVDELAGIDQVTWSTYEKDGHETILTIEPARAPRLRGRAGWIDHPTCFVVCTNVLDPATE